MQFIQNLFFNQKKNLHPFYGNIFNRNIDFQLINVRIQILIFELLNATFFF
jgi:hypothetical protein